jgi:invasion protein IalB
MTRLHLHSAAAALALIVASPVLAQQFPAPEGDGLPGFGTLPESGTAAPEAPTPPAEAETDADAPDDADDDADADDAADEAEEETDAAAPDLVAPSPEVYEIVRDTFDDWEVRCAPEGDDCFLYQLALDSDGNPVAEFSLVRLPAGGQAAAGATVVTPLGTLLPAGLVMQIDTGEARQYPFTFCSQVGCFAQVALTQQSVSALQRGRTARLEVTSIAAPETPVQLDISLIGFTAAYNSIQPAQ